MDAIKRETSVDYTAWDLNCPHVVHKKNRQEWEARFKRKARRKNKIFLKKLLTNPALCDRI